MRLRIGFKQCSCDYSSCEACSHTGTVPYWQPPRWVEIMAAIVTQADRRGGWLAGGRSGTYVDIGGDTRPVHVEDEGSDKRSLRMLCDKGYAAVCNASIYRPTKGGRDALSAALARFEAARKRRGTTPKRAALETQTP